MLLYHTEYGVSQKLLFIYLLVLYLLLLFAGLVAGLFYTFWVTPVKELETSLSLCYSTYGYTGMPYRYVLCTVRTGRRLLLLQFSGSVMTRTSLQEAHLSNHRLDYSTPLPLRAGRLLQHQQKKQNESRCLELPLGRLEQSQHLLRRVRKGLTAKVEDVYLGGTAKPGSAAPQHFETIRASFLEDFRLLGRNVFASSLERLVVVVDTRNLRCDTPLGTHGWRPAEFCQRSGQYGY
jgi:hypothetical protein